MLDGTTNGALMLALLPVFAVIGISLNLFIRARGGRSFSLRLKAFGIDLTIETSAQRATAQEDERDVS